MEQGISPEKTMQSFYYNGTRRIWSKCPATTDAVERTNKDSTSDIPQGIKLAMISVYKVYKVTCLKHIAAEEGVSLSLALKK